MAQFVHEPAREITFRAGKNYSAPAVRMLRPKFDIPFLISNTEVIIDDGQEHGWD